jgi:hypothetical protein
MWIMKNLMYCLTGGTLQRAGCSNISSTETMLQGIP